MGFQHLDKHTLRETSRKGGRAVAAKGTGHRWNADQARAAGIKSGKAIRAKRRAQENRENVS